MTFGAGDDFWALKFSGAPALERFLQVGAGAGADRRLGGAPHQAAAARRQRPWPTRAVTALLPSAPHPPCCSPTTRPSSRIGSAWSPVRPTRPRWVLDTALRAAGCAAASCPSTAPPAEGNQLGAPRLASPPSLRRSLPTSCLAARMTCRGSSGRRQAPAGLAARMAARRRDSRRRPAEPPSPPPLTQAQEMASPPGLETRSKPPCH